MSRPFQLPIGNLSTENQGTNGSIHPGTKRFDGQDQSITLKRNQHFDVVLGVTDASGSTLTFTILSQPTHGTLGPVNSNVVRYTATFGYVGTDSFTFKANNGSVDSSVGTVSLTVANTKPVAHDIVYSTPQDTSDSLNPIILKADDADGDPLTYIIVTPPSHGSLVGSSNSYVYTGSFNFSGPDSFTYKANDGLADSNIATVSITVLHMVHSPTAANLSVDANDNPVVTTISLPIYDLDPANVVVTIVQAPQHGVLGPVVGSPVAVSAGNPGVVTVTYTPNVAFVGQDKFKYSGFDGVNATVPDGSVFVNVKHVNHAPTTVNQQENCATGKGTLMILNGADQDVNDVNFLAWKIVAQPAAGNLVANGGDNFTYTPNPGTVVDTFTFKCNDVANNPGAGLDSNVSTCTLNVIPKPTATPQSGLSCHKNLELTVQLAGVTHAGPLTFSQNQGFLGLKRGGPFGPMHGNVFINKDTGVCFYVPDTGYVGADSFQFVVNDGVQDSDPATISVTVANDAPTASAVSGSGNKNTASTSPKNTIVVTLLGSDQNNDQLTYSLVTTPSPSEGTAVISGSQLTFTPADGDSGVTTISYKCNDGPSNPGAGLDSNTANIVLTVVNHAPVAQNDSESTLENTFVVCNLVGTDADGDSLTFTIVANPAFGVLSGKTQTTPTSAIIVYTPNSNAAGSDSFTYKCNDGTLDSNIATVSVQVGGPPTIDSIADQNTSAFSTIPVNLTGIGRGSGYTGTLTVDTFSSNTSVATSSVASYTSPNSTGQINVSGAGSNGTAMITVRVTQTNGLTATTTFHVTVGCSCLGNPNQIPDNGANNTGVMGFGGPVEVVFSKTIDAFSLFNDTTVTCQQGPISNFGSPFGPTYIVRYSLTNSGGCAVAVTNAQLVISGPGLTTSTQSYGSTIQINPGAVVQMEFPFPQNMLTCEAVTFALTGTNTDCTNQTPNNAQTVNLDGACHPPNGAGSQPTGAVFYTSDCTNAAVTNGQGSKSVTFTIMNTDLTHCVVAQISLLQATTGCLSLVSVGNNSSYQNSGGIIGIFNSVLVPGGSATVTVFFAGSCCDPNNPEAGWTAGIRTFCQAGVTSVYPSGTHNCPACTLLCS